MFCSRAGDEISANVRGLSAFTLYAFRVDAFVIDKKGVKSSIAYFRTKETSKNACLQPGRSLRNLLLIILTLTSQFTYLWVDLRHTSTKCAQTPSSLVFKFVMISEPRFHSFLVPSPPLALQVNFLSSDSLQVTWKEPFFPNGEITHYVLSYQESYSSHWWKNDIDWCKNQDLPRLGTTDQAQNQDNGKSDESENRCLFVFT